MGFMILFTVLLIILALVLLHFDQKFKYWKYLGVPFVKPDFFYGNLKGVGTKIHTYELMLKVYL